MNFLFNIFVDHSFELLHDLGCLGCHIQGRYVNNLHIQTIIVYADDRSTDTQTDRQTRTEVTRTDCQKCKKLLLPKKY